LARSCSFTGPPPTSRENRRSTSHRPGHDQHASQSGLSLQINRGSSPSCSAERCTVPLRLPTSSTSCRCSRAVRPRRAPSGGRCATLQRGRLRAGGRSLR
jgi:hypothetical protein